MHYHTIQVCWKENLYSINYSNYRSQKKFAKVKFSQVFVCPQGGLCPGGGLCQEGSLSGLVPVWGVSV